LVDIPGNASTTTTVTVGSSTINVLESVEDHDWFKVNLTSGQEITVALDAIGVEPDLDTYLIIRNSSGAILYEDDDIHTGVDTDSLISFVANYTGVYYIDVGSFEESSAGDYRLNVTAFQTPPIFTNDQIAQQLTSGYWGDGAHPFNVSSGGTITVNILGLTAAGQNLARKALQNWSEITGLSFQEVSGAAQINFSDDGSPEGGAWTESFYDANNHFTTSATVNIEASWLGTYGSQVGSYAYQAYLHEIGHALGLGHAGNYNTVANYPYDAAFLNDSWATTIMSYFSQEDSEYFADLGFTYLNLVTPMVADIIAMQQLYGLSTTTRSGNTTYGFNSNAGNQIYNANVSTGGITNVALTIFDTGGTDTFDYSATAATQRINLNPEAFSNVLGQTGNLSIARGTIIENAIGGNGIDVIVGNSANNVLSGGRGDDTLSGGAGTDTLNGGNRNDTFRDTVANLNGDTISDFSLGDRIILTNAAMTGFTFGVVGNTLSYTGGSLTLGGAVDASRLIATAAESGGVQISFLPEGAGRAGDFNGDGRDDILWRNNDGRMTNWLGISNGDFGTNAANALNSVAVDWHVAGIGDFNGDNRDDVLWRNNDGRITNWLGTHNGGYTDNATNGLSNVSNDWQIAGVGDFNGDGRDDILWRNADGRITDWLGVGNGSFSSNGVNSLNAVALDWKIAAIGDFNGDGRDDILWRNADGRITNWLGAANGGFTDNVANAYNGVSLDWQVAGAGDFNGDGRDDILWRNVDGRMTDWLGNGSGGYSSNAVNTYHAVSFDWQVHSIGDFNGDGRDDILWRNVDGRITDWLGTSSGGFADNIANAYNAVSTDWHIQPDVLWP
jgi:hypothetical protein